MVDFLVGGEQRPERHVSRRLCVLEGSFPWVVTFPTAVT